MKTETQTVQDNALVEAYLVKGSIISAALAASKAHFALVVSPLHETVTGKVTITNGSIKDFKTIQADVKGTIRSTGYGDVTKIVDLKGFYYTDITIPIPPFGHETIPIPVPVTLFMDVNNEWNGNGGFSYGNHKVNGTVTSE